MNREAMLQQLTQTDHWDILIIGGGATGLGAAVDAASRGYRTLLIEKKDFAHATSSRSTKLIHGGVRYLEQGNLKLVKESLRERGLLLKNAPHVCHNLGFVLPVFAHYRKWYYGIGLKIYDLLAGSLQLGKTKILSSKKTADSLPNFSHASLKGGVLYHDGQFDDSRLAINLAATAADYGATLINYCSLNQFIKINNKITGAEITDTLSGKSFRINASVTINATGVFTDQVLQLDEPGAAPMLEASRGVHIVVDKSFFPSSHAFIIPKTDDGRVLFAVPWHDKVVIGTTDTAVDGITDDPAASREEIDFIISHINRYLSAPIHYRDVLSVYAGLRPLLTNKQARKTSVLPRDHITRVSTSGLVTITGGKWTTYRSMAEQAVDNAVFVAKLEKKKSITRELRIHGYAAGNNDRLAVYGSDAAFIRQLFSKDPALSALLHPELPYSRAEIVWAVQSEMAMTVEDVLARRNRALLLNAKAAVEAAPAVALLMAGAMGKDEAWQKQQIHAFEKLAQHYIIDYFV